MTESEQIEQLADLLLAKTKAKELDWSPTIPTGSFLTSLPRHSVKLESSRPVGSIAALSDIEAATYYLTVYNEAGSVITATNNSLANVVKHLGNPSLNAKLGELYRLVVATTNSANEELDELLQELREAV